MDFVRREDIRKNELPGRVVQNAVGRNSAVASEKMTVSFCRYSAESGDRILFLVHVVLLKQFW